MEGEDDDYRAGSLNDDNIFSGKPNQDVTIDKQSSPKIRENDRGYQDHDKSGMDLGGLGAEDEFAPV